MKNENRVKEIIDELKILAESDFELHRISVLEKDLISPPKVEQVDETHQKFDGVTYRRDTSGHYILSTQIHRIIWQYYFGEIPEGNYQVHHVDWNPENNAIENLQLLTTAEHRRIHNVGAELKTYVCQNCGKEFLSNRIGGVMYCSVKCREEYRYKKKDGANFEDRYCEVCGKKFRTEKRSRATTCCKKCAAAKKRKNYSPLKITVTCAHCGKSFETNKSRPAKFCSEHCKNIEDYVNHQETRTCVICGQNFSCIKYGKTKVCSAKCARALALQNYTPVPKTEERTCVICGKKFTCNKAKPTRTCSHRCGSRLAWQHRENFMSRK